MSKWLRQSSPSHALTKSGNKLYVGDKILLANKRSGKVISLGPKLDKDGLWVRVVMDNAHMSNDNNRSNKSKTILMPIQRVDKIITSGKKFDLTIDDRVIERKRGISGTIKYVGPTHFAKSVWFGVALDTPKGKNNGTVKKKFYFLSEPNHGLMVPYKRLEHENKRRLISNAFDKNGGNDKEKYQHFSNTISIAPNTFQLLHYIYDREKLLLSGYCRESTNAHIPHPIVNYCLVYAFCRCYIKELDMEKLNQTKEEAKKENNLPFIFDIEQLMLQKAVTSQWNINEQQYKIWFDQDALRCIFNEWIYQKKVNKFRNKIVECTKKCIEIDNVYILKIILQYCNHKKNMYCNRKRNNELIEFINEAAKYGSIHCIKLLFESHNQINWSEQKRPIVLYNAVRYHPENIEMIKFIIEKLETLTFTFICDDVMKQVIKFDLDEIAKIIVENGWHKIDENDEKLAERINLNCHLYFKERSYEI